MNTGSTVTGDGMTIGRSVFVIFLLVCVAGMAISIELTRVHYFTHTDPAYQSICSLNEKINCKTVARSPFSVFANLPGGVWGFLGYVLMPPCACLARPFT